MSAETIIKRLQSKAKTSCVFNIQLTCEEESAISDRLFEIFVDLMTGNTQVNK